jgi:hypothetical protein
MHKSAMKCNETLSKWCKNKHGASKIIDTFETYQLAVLMPTRIPPDLPCGGRQYHEKSSPPEIWRRKGAVKSDLPVLRIAKKSSLKFLIVSCTKECLAESLKPSPFQKQPIISAKLNFLV